jgi:hypothetical protein
MMAISIAGGRSATVSGTAEFISMLMSWTGALDRAE